MEDARIPLIRSWHSQERMRLPALRGSGLTGSRRYLSWPLESGRYGERPAHRGERALHKPGSGVYTFLTRSLLLGACEERRKERTMFIARMVAVL